MASGSARSRRSWRRRRCCRPSWAAIRRSCVRSSKQRCRSAASRPSPTSPTRRCFLPRRRPHFSPATCSKSTAAAAFRHLGTKTPSALPLAKTALLKPTPLDVDDLAAAPRKAAPNRFAAPAAATAIDAVEVVAGTIVAARCHCRGRRRPHDRDAPLRSLELDQRVHMVVTVNDELGSLPRQRRAKLAAVDEALEVPPWLADRRMVHHDHAKEPFACVALERRGKDCDLLAAEMAGRQEGRGWHRRR